MTILSRIGWSGGQWVVFGLGTIIVLAIFMVICFTHTPEPSLIESLDENGGTIQTAEIVVNVLPESNVYDMKDYLYIENTGYSYNNPAGMNVWIPKNAIQTILINGD